MLRTGHSLWGAQTGDQNIALHISAVGIGLLQSLLLCLGEGHFHANLHLLTGLHRNQSGAVPGQEQMYVIGIDGAVAVQIRFVSAGDGRAAYDIVHQSLAVGHVDFPITVEVQAGQRLRQRQSRAVRSPGSADLQSLRLGIQIGFSILPEGSLGEEVGAEPVGQGLVGDVLQGEGEAVEALAIRIVSQLGLYLAVRRRVGSIFVHQDHTVGGDGAIYIGQAGALLENRVVVAAVLTIPDGGGRGHDQRLDELPGVQTGLFLQPAFPDVLGQNRRDTGNLGRGHGGAGVVGIALAAVGDAVQRVDVAAGSCDLRLQLQGTGNAPTGEVAHGLVLVSPESVVDLVGDG